MLRKTLTFGACVFVLLCCLVPVQAGTIVLQDGQSGYAGTDDVYMRTANSTGNLGGYTMFAAWGSTGNSLIRFDLTGVVPAGSTITSATVSLYNYGCYSSGDTTVSMHRVKQDWNEGTGTTTTPDYSYGATWYFYKQDGGDVRWDSVTDGASGAEGSGNIEAAIDTASWSSTDDPDFIDFDVTSDVAAFVGGTKDNNGWMITEWTTTVCPKFRSSEYTDDTSLRPILTIEYIPEPATIGLLLAGGLGFVIRRRK